MQKLFWYVDSKGAEWGPFTYEQSLEIDETPNPDGETYGWREITEEEFTNLLSEELDSDGTYTETDSGDWIRVS